MKGGALRLAVLVGVLLLLHFTVRPALGWRASMDFALIATMVVGVRVRPGAAALIGFAVGLVADAATPDSMGSSSLALACIAFGSSFLKASFFSDKPAMNAFLFFLGKWTYDIVFVLVQGNIGDGPSIGHLFTWSPLSALLTAAVGVMMLSVAGVLPRQSRE